MAYRPHPALRAGIGANHAFKIVRQVTDSIDLIRALAALGDNISNAAPIRRYPRWRHSVPRHRQTEGEAHGKAPPGYGNERSSGAYPLTSR